ncbi:hypothetical protein Hamer_G004278 [Homarus americanus]|uniref:Uncharacterized protein n=1 Tax=Homarus americanus TaxID=6706 RepID=A0A8J5JUT4_HOMAM|nr:hypothetical protein Hamer_G004278 [Homarus americanus]
MGMLGKKKMEVLMHKRKESPSEMPISDKRGHNPSTGAIIGSYLQHVHENIRALPVLASIYSRAHSPHSGTWRPEAASPNSTAWTTTSCSVLLSPTSATPVRSWRPRSLPQKDGEDTSDVRSTLREHKAIAQVPWDLLHQSQSLQLPCPCLGRKDHCCQPQTPSPRHKTTHKTSNNKKQNNKKLTPTALHFYASQEGNAERLFEHENIDTLLPLFQSMENFEVDKNEI